MLSFRLVLLSNGRAFHTCSYLNSKPAKVLRKIMGSNTKRKYYPGNSPILPNTSNIFSPVSLQKKVTGNPRRSTILNKLFMRHITDLMATGEYSTQIIGYGIEVNKVKISPDYTILKVYWIAKESEDQDAIEVVLRKNAGLLRHELSKLNVMGKVPTILFLKDKTYYKILDVEKRLAIADFGEDHEPINLEDQLITGCELWTTLDTSIRQKLEKLELDFPENMEDDLLEIPPMPQNIMGLNHADIFSQIKKRIQVSEAPHRKTDQSETLEWSQFKLSQPVNSDPVVFANCQEQREDFKAFLRSRQILKLKERRAEKNNFPETEYILQEMKEKHLSSLKSLVSEELEEDYITEDIEETETDK